MRERIDNQELVDGLKRYVDLGIALATLENDQPVLVVGLGKRTSIVEVIIKRPNTGPLLSEELEDVVRVAREHEFEARFIASSNEWWFEAKS